MISPVGNFRNRSNEGTTQEFDDCSWFLAFGWRNHQTRIDPFVNPVTITAVAVSPHVPVGNHLHRGVRRNDAASTHPQPIDISRRRIGFEAFEWW